MFCVVGGLIWIRLIGNGNSLKSAAGADEMSLLMAVVTLAGFNDNNGSTRVTTGAFRGSNFSVIRDWITTNCRSKNTFVCQSEFIHQHSGISQRRGFLLIQINNNLLWKPIFKLFHQHELAQIIKGFSFKT